MINDYVENIKGIEKVADQFSTVYKKGYDDVISSHIFNIAYNNLDKEKVKEIKKKIDLYSSTPIEDKQSLSNFILSGFKKRTRLPNMEEKSNYINTLPERINYIQDVKNKLRINNLTVNKNFREEYINKFPILKNTWEYEETPQGRESLRKLDPIVLKYLK